MAVHQSRFLSNIPIGEIFSHHLRESIHLSDSLDIGDQPYMGTILEYFDGSIIPDILQDCSLQGWQLVELRVDPRALLFDRRMDAVHAPARTRPYPRAHDEGAYYVADAVRLLGNAAALP